MTKIPNFSLPGSDGKTHSPKDFAGSPWILYFYPKDNTSGCTVEACDFRDLGKEFAKRGATVVGVSPDSIKSHAGFIEKQKLNFLLLSDEQKDLAEKMNVWVEKSMYGRKYMGIERSTFLIDAKGAIVKEWRKVKVKGHVEDVLRALKEAATSSSSSR